MKQQQPINVKLETPPPVVNVDVKPVSPLTKREEVWLRAWCCVASDHRVTETGVAKAWANNCLRAFEEKFGDI